MKKLSFNFKNIEKKWQNYWEKNKCHKVDFKKSYNKFYMLEMFSYPSGDKLHCGHWYNFGPSDTYARYKKMQGFNVFQPMGFDAFGLPAENNAIKKGVHPKESTKENIDYMMKQLKGIGAMYDWSKYIDTSDPNYYKWTQWVFLKLYKKGLAYRKKAPVNWCPSCNTVLANEQVINEKQCERCESFVIKKELTQWFFKITDYAEDLLKGHEIIDWPEKTISMQKNWIGKSVGAELDFDVEGHKIPVFTTRPDTLFGVTYIVFAPEHPIVKQITKPEYKEKVEQYLASTLEETDIERLSTTRKKTGVFTGAYAINPINGEKIPVWISDYVLYSYGTGAVMAVPAHDQRDFEFATKFNLKIRKVILEKGTKPEDELEQAYDGEGTVINSNDFNGMHSEKFKKKIVEILEKENKGRAKINYRLRDWLISRQRYWGTPIPIIYCDKCGEVPVPEENLPVKLPYNVEFKPKGKSPLASNKDFINTKCPKCGSAAKRDPDTMDTFVCSSWYYFRYPSANQKEVAFDEKITKEWLPVDQYVGGAEHATMHLLYARFIAKVLVEDREYEPFLRLIHQGMILSHDGQRMSKSKGNVIPPDPYVEKYGSDVFRAYLMFNFAYTEGGPWNDSQIIAVDKFLKRVFRLVEKHLENFDKNDSYNNKKNNVQPKNKNEKLLFYQMHHTIKNVNIDIEKFQFNTCIARIMEFVNELYKYSQLDRKKQRLEIIKYSIEILILLLAPFVPHLSEELWEKTGHTPTIFDEKYPEHDNKFLKKEEFTLVVQVNGKIRAKIKTEKGKSEQEIREIVFNNENIKKWIKDKKIKKFIYIKDKIVSIVV